MATPAFVRGKNPGLEGTDANGTTSTFALDADPVAGQTFVLALCAYTSGTLTSVSIGGTAATRKTPTTNAYDATNHTTVEIWVVENHAGGTNRNVVVTYGSNNAGNGGNYLLCYAYTLDSGVVDIGPSLAIAQGTSTAPAISSGTLGDANEFVIAVVNLRNQDATITQPSSPWTGRVNVGTWSATEAGAIADRTTTATTSVTATWGFDPSSQWSAAMVTLKAAAALTTGTVAATGVAGTMALDADNVPKGTLAGTGVAGVGAIRGSNVGRVACTGVAGTVAIVGKNIPTGTIAATGADGFGSVAAEQIPVADVACSGVSGTSAIDADNIPKGTLASTGVAGAMALRAINLGRVACTGVAGAMALDADNIPKGTLASTGVEGLGNIDAGDLVQGDVEGTGVAGTMVLDADNVQRGTLAGTGVAGACAIDGDNIPRAGVAGAGVAGACALEGVTFPVGDVEGTGVAGTCAIDGHVHQAALACTGVAGACTIRVENEITWTTFEKKFTALLTRIATVPGNRPNVRVGG